MCDSSHMATNLQIDDALLTEALNLGGFRTKKETVNRALDEFIKRLKRQRIWELEGKIESDFDYKKARSKR